MSQVKNNPANEPVNIYAIRVNYVHENGDNEKSEPKYCGQSEEDAVKAISQMLGICRTCLPPSISVVSYSVEGYRRSSFERGSEPDYRHDNVVVQRLRNYDQSGSK